jgi:hypothetical protein
VVWGAPNPLIGADGSWIALMGDGGNKAGEAGEEGDEGGESGEGEVVSSTPGGGVAAVEAEADAVSRVAAVSPRLVAGAGPLRPHAFKPELKVRRRVMEHECADLMRGFFRERREATKAAKQDAAEAEAEAELAAEAAAEAYATETTSGEASAQTPGGGGGVPTWGVPLWTAAAGAAGAGTAAAGGAEVGGSNPGGGSGGSAAAAAAAPAAAVAPAAAKKKKKNPLHFLSDVGGGAGGGGAFVVEGQVCALSRTRRCTVGGLYKSNPVDHP